MMLVSTILLARMLSPHDYGLVAMVVAVIGVGEIFRDFGLSMAALQAKSLSQQQQSNLFWINSGVGAALGLVVFSCSSLLASFYDASEVTAIAQVLAATFVLGGLSTQFKVRINRELRFVALAAADLLPYALGIASAIALALLGGGYWALVAQQLVIALGTLTLSVFLSRWWPSLPRRAPMKGLISFGASFAATQLISYASRNVDSVLLGRFWGSTSLGFYDRAYNLVLLPLSQINTPMSRVAVPVLSRTAQDDQRYVAYLRRAQLVALYVTSAAFAFLAGLGTPLIVLVLGDQWGSAGPLLSVLAIAGIFRSLAQVAYWIYMSRGLAGEQLKFYLLAQPLLIATIVCGVPFGPMGVAIAVAIGYALFWAGSLAWVTRATGLSLGILFVDSLWAIGVIALPIGASSFVVRIGIESAGYGGLPQLLGGAFAGFACCFLSWCLFPRVRYDSGLLLDFVRRAIGKGS